VTSEVARAHRHYLALLAVTALLEYLVIWGFGRIIQWLLDNADHLQALFTRATDWLNVHDISITNLVTENYIARCIIGVAREIGGKGYRLITFAVIAM
jgi:hypothetical protein